MMERVLGLDIGDRRIGVAISDPLGITAQPLGMIESKGWGPDIRQISAYVERYRCTLLVVGLPLLLNGSQGEQAKKVIAFVAQMEKAGFVVALWDERMSSAIAERVLIAGDVSRERRKKIVDQTAAAVILQGYLDANRQSCEVMEGD